MKRFFRTISRIAALLRHCLRHARYVRKHQAELSDMETARCVQSWAQGILDILNVKLEVEGKIPDENGLLLVSNHQGCLDIPVHGALCRNIRFTPNTGIRNWFLFGSLVALSRPVWIDRGSPAKAKQTLAEFRKTLLDGMTLVIYPEGTTTSGKVPLLPFKSTAFEAVTETAVPVVPILTEYTVESPDDVHPAWFDDMPFLQNVLSFLGNKGIRVHIKVLEPVYAMPGEDRKHLAERIREILEDARITYNSHKEYTT